MRTRIKVTDLTLRQWDRLQDQLQPSYNIPDGAVRVCVEFELTTELDPRHVEMPVRAFMMLVTQLQQMVEHDDHAELVREGRADLPPLPAKWSAPLSGPARLPVLPTADEVRHLSAAGAVKLAAEMNAGPTCDHGSPVIEETPSAFEGGEPARTYADGCQSYGPYQTTDQG